MQYGLWQKNKSKDKYYIRREVLPRLGNSKWESYKGNYNSTDIEAIDSLLRRLNAKHTQQKKLNEARYDYDHTYINKPILERFELHLSKFVSSETIVKKNMAFLTKAFNFFILKKNLPVPNEWPKYEAEFGKYIESLKLGYDSMQRITQVTNRYLKFLHLQYPEEIPSIVLVPIAPKKIRTLEEQTKLKLRDGSRFVDADKWQFIKENISPEIRPHVILAYSFGLRRAEVLGLTEKSFFKGYVYIAQQLVKYKDEKPTYDKLKDTTPRKVPYWYIKPSTALNLFDQMKLMHPDTLSSKFGSEMTRLSNLYQAKFKKEIDLTYTMHDLRRTFITKAVAEYPINEVRLAVGHDDLSTTSGYLQDVRNFDDEPLR